MQIEPSRDYHTRRARGELDLAYRANCRAAMEAHLRLSALHMARLREEMNSNGREARAADRVSVADERAVALAC